MGLRDWVFGRDESALDAANRLRGEAREAPGAVDVEQLVALYAEADDHPAARAAAKGIEALGEREPERLVGHVPTLVAAVDRLEGVGSKQRGRVATAIEHLAADVPEEVAESGPAIVETLERELDADETVGNGLYLDEQKVAALARAAAAADVQEAEPVLKRYRRHSEPRVSDAARDALSKL